MTRSATWIVGGSQNELEGETSPSESAPETVTILNVDPGSYVLSTVWFRWCGGQIAGKRLASYVGALAIARTAPFLGLSTIAVASLAFQSWTACRRRLSTVACRV